MSKDITTITAFKIIDSFYRIYPEMLNKSNTETVAFIETLADNAQIIYKSAILHIARSGGWKEGGH